MRQAVVTSGEHWGKVISTEGDLWRLTLFHGHYLRDLGECGNAGEKKIG